MKHITRFTKVSKFIFKAYASLIYLIDPGSEGNPYVRDQAIDSVIRIAGSPKLIPVSFRRRIMMRM